MKKNLALLIVVSILVYISIGWGGLCPQIKKLSCSLGYCVRTIAVDDVTPDISGGNIFVTSANNGATAITDLDSPVAGQVVTIVCGSTTNASTLGDSGNFTLTGAWSPDTVGDNISLYVHADNTYYEIGRSNN